MKYDHGQTHADLVVGGEYDYTEDGMPARVRLLEDTSVAPNGPINLKLEVVFSPISTYKPGTVFDVFAAEGHYAYSGMWRIWEAGEYLFGNPGRAALQEKADD